mgnify:CR=1 FL=1
MIQARKGMSARFSSLDVLRGTAILGMVFSGVVPRGILPAWMYHAQVGPPDHVFNPNLPGLTWVDLVFPFFLFCMGVAFPLSLRKMIEQGVTNSKIVLRILQRGLALGTFAILLQHMRPHQIENPPGITIWLTAILGLFVLFGVYSRYGHPFLQSKEKWIRRGSWLVLLLWIPFFNLISDNSFSLGRSDIILIVLTNMAIAGGLIWLFTRDYPLIRLGILALFLAFRLAHGESEWMQAAWSSSPVPWLFRWDYLKYLFIVIPGTFAGEILLWSAKQKFDRMKIMHSSILSVLTGTLLLTSLIGYQSRWLVGTTLILSALTAVGLLLSTKISNASIAKLIYWGSFWLVLGILFEPFEGGIKKDPSTLSYYFLGAGLAHYLLASLTVWGEQLNGSRLARLLRDNGRNPMVAYVLMANLIWPLSALLGIEHQIQKLAGNAGLLLTIAILKTLILALIVQSITKRGWQWKT